MPSAWTEHLSSFRASHPSKTMKECMIEASACYRKPSSAAPSKAAKKSAPKAAPKTVPKAASSSNPWIAHVQAYRATHACSYAEAMQGAKKTYRAPTSNACPSKRSTSLRAVGKSRYRANTYCTWSIALDDDTPVHAYVNYLCWCFHVQRFYTWNGSTARHIQRSRTRTLQGIFQHRGREMYKYFRNTTVCVCWISTTKMILKNTRA